MKHKVLFAHERCIGQSWCQAGRSGMSWWGRNSLSTAGQSSGNLNISKTSPEAQCANVLHPQALGCTKWSHHTSSRWKGLPGGSKGFKLLCFLCFSFRCTYHNLFLSPLVLITTLHCAWLDPCLIICPPIRVYLCIWSGQQLLGLAFLVRFFIPQIMWMWSKPH